MWAYNPETHKMELEPVLHVWIDHDNDLVDLTLTTTTLAQHGKPAIKTSEVIHTNKKHPFLTTEHGFLPVAQIVVGMHVLRADGTYGVVTGWRIVPGAKVMYNLEVAQDHTFTVGVGQWVVHNCGNDLFPNKMPDRLTTELNSANDLGVKPLSPGDPGFDEMVNGGRVKWAVTEDGNLQFVPKYVNQTEIYHTVITGGGPVQAAGEADIVAGDGQYWVTDITNWSGHYEPDLNSLENIAKPLFLRLGFLGL